MNEAIKNIEIKKFDILRNTILSSEDFNNIHSSNGVGLHTDIHPTNGIGLHNGDYLSESFYKSNKVSEDKMKILKELDEQLLFLKEGSN